MTTPDRRFLVLHGAANRRPPAHWHYWLVEELRLRHETVLYPQLPEPDFPRLEDWAQLARAELAQLGTGERVVVCHSASTLAWLHLAAELAPSERAHRVLLVAPPSGAKLWPEIMHFLPVGELSPSVASAGSESTRIVCSDNDPYCPQRADVLYGRPLGVPVDIVAGGGHLSLDDGYGPWPAMLSWCLDAAVPLTGRA